MRGHRTCRTQYGGVDHRAILQAGEARSNGRLRSKVRSPEWMNAGKDSLVSCPVVPLLFNSMEIGIIPCGIATWAIKSKGATRLVPVGIASHQHTTPLDSDRVRVTRAPVLALSTGPEHTAQGTHHVITHGTLRCTAPPSRPHQRGVTTSLPPGGDGRVRRQHPGEGRQGPPRHAPPAGTPLLATGT